ncbi:hypothetical protein OB236_08980 [Paenibacillus sp. WQ 127069]|uniref:Uncharacterized protein n=1 Tax=Paenibacillus baimaensis TaxID=2982185 RepID=A0ABT2UC97_9BACL|nr:hypothetical protein [Paenibacillus sp. WQ 127069]MCU6792260.1 hypothetical protein [Paenibacillus sp. WQ 127069]
MKKKPHILIFNPEQWRSDVMGHMGNPAAVTPYLDQLVFLPHKTGAPSQT